MTTYYDWISWQQQSIKAFALAGDYADALVNNPFNPFSYFPQSQALSKYNDILRQSQVSFDKPEFEFNDKQIINKVVHKNPFCKTIKFSKNQKSGENILILSPLSGNYSTIFCNFIEGIFKHIPNANVFITDWENARDVPLSEGEFNLEANVDFYSQLFDNLKPEHLICYSQSGNPALIALALLNPKKNSNIKTCSLLGVPFDNNIKNKEVDVGINMMVNGGSLDNSNGCFFEVSKPYLGCGRKVLPGALQYLSLRSLGINKEITLQINLLSTLFFSPATPIEVTKKSSEFKKQINSVMDLDAGHVIDNINHFFIGEYFVNNKLKLFGKIINLKNIKNINVLSVEGKDDMLCLVGQTSSLLPKLTSLTKKQKQQIVANCGHFGLIMGEKFQNNLLPKIINFIQTK